MTSVKRGRPRIRVSLRLSDDAAERLWQLYEQEFEPYRERALLAHLYPREAFDALLNDTSVYKIIAHVDEEPIGMSMVTPNLEVVPQISPAFLRKRFPEQAARDAIFYGIMSIVEEAYRSTTVYGRLLVVAGEIAAQKSGVVVYDVCSYAEEQGVHKYPARVASWFEGGTFEELDAQTYYATILPSPVCRVPIGDVEIDVSEDMEIDLTLGEREAASRSDPSRGDQRSRQ